MQKTGGQTVMITLRNSIICNAALSVLKLFAGIYAHSAAMISDSADSLSDILSTVIVVIGVRLAGKKSDKGHPYGHERMECVAALILAAIMFATGAGVGFAGARRLFIPNASDVGAPGIFALIVAVVSIAIKECMYRYTRFQAKKSGSSVLLAEARHHRSDALSSVSSFIGILGARLGIPALDPIACVIICLLIIKASYDIFRSAIDRMTDHACDDEVVEEILAIIMGSAGVSGVDKLKTRLFGDKIYVDVEISASGEYTLNEAHGVAQRVHDAIEARFSNVKHCMVHVNPARDDE